LTSRTPKLDTAVKEKKASGVKQGDTRSKGQEHTIKGSQGRELNQKSIPETCEQFKNEDSNESAYMNTNYSRKMSDRYRNSDLGDITSPVHFVAVPIDHPRVIREVTLLRQKLLRVDLQNIIHNGYIYGNSTQNSGKNKHTFLITFEYTGFSSLTCTLQELLEFTSYGTEIRYKEK